MFSLNGIKLLILWRSSSSKTVSSLIFSSVSTKLNIWRKPQQQNYNKTLLNQLLALPVCSVLVDVQTTSLDRCDTENLKHHVSKASSAQWGACESESPPLISNVHKGLFNTGTFLCCLILTSSTLWASSLSLVVSKSKRTRQGRASGVRSFSGTYQSVTDTEPLSFLLLCSL